MYFYRYTNNFKKTHIATKYFYLWYKKYIYIGTSYSITRVKYTNIFIFLFSSSKAKTDQRSYSANTEKNK